MDGGYVGGGAGLDGDSFGTGGNRAKFPASGKDDPYTTPERREALQKAESWAREVVERAKEQERNKSEEKTTGTTSSRKLSLGLGKRGKGYAKISDADAGRASNASSKDTPMAADIASAPDATADSSSALAASEVSTKDYGTPEITDGGRRKSWMKKIFK